MAYEFTPKVHDTDLIRTIERCLSVHPNLRIQKRLSKHGWDEYRMADGHWSTTLRVAIAMWARKHNEKMEGGDVLKKGKEKPMPMPKKGGKHC